MQKKKKKISKLIHSWVNISFKIMVKFPVEFTDQYLEFFERKS